MTEETDVSEIEVEIEFLRQRAKEIREYADYADSAQARERDLRIVLAMEDRIAELQRMVKSESCRI